MKRNKSENEHLKKVHVKQEKSERGQFWKRENQKRTHCERKPLTKDNYEQNKKEKNHFEGEKTGKRQFGKETIEKLYI